MQRGQQQLIVEKRLHAPAFLEHEKGIDGFETYIEMCTAHIGPEPGDPGKGGVTAMFT